MLQWRQVVLEMQCESEKAGLNAGWRVSIPEFFITVGQSKEGASNLQFSIIIWVVHSCPSCGQVVYESPRTPHRVLAASPHTHCLLFDAIAKRLQPTPKNEKTGEDVRIVLLWILPFSVLAMLYKRRCEEQFWEQRRTTSLKEVDSQGDHRAVASLTEEDGMKRWFGRQHRVRMTLGLSIGKEHILCPRGELQLSRTLTHRLLQWRLCKTSIPAMLTLGRPLILQCGSPQPTTALGNVGRGPTCTTYLLPSCLTVLLFLTFCEFNWGSESWRATK